MLVSLPPLAFGSRVETANRFDALGARVGDRPEDSVQKHEAVDSRHDAESGGKGSHAGSEAAGCTSAWLAVVLRVAEIHHLQWHWLGADHLSHFISKSRTVAGSL